ncbi:tail protein [Maribacter phage Colly_1]|uniref:Tail protein n=1 Tax=Maribacter phage Colly_1 TaxID=2745691 RepID=A0A8E4UY22_9CAUD|nr:tail protein [Maribacter phage Colly_1]QQO97343.1 tail protein [Maribacter phage Colly_1]
MALTNLGKTGLNLREQDLLDRILVGSTDPSGVVSSNIGDLYLVPSIPDLFINMDGITTWKNISSLVELEVDDSAYNTLQKIVDKLKASELAISEIQVSDIADLQDYLDNLSVSDIQNLQPALDGKVDKVAGKGLSTNDFTIAYRNDVDSNTSHRARTDNPHGVSKSQVGLGNVNNTSDLSKPISTLQQVAFDTKVDKVTGKELSDNNYTDEDKSTVINASSHMDSENNPHGVTDTQLGLGTGHYREPLSTTTELSALPQDDLVEGERRYVAADNSDYFYFPDVLTGDLAPDDQTGGLGFWVKSSADADLSGYVSKTESETISGAKVFTAEHTIFQGSSVDRYVRFAESVGQFNGAFLQYEGSTNKFHIGVHIPETSDTADDTKVITIQRSNGYIGINKTSPTTEFDLVGSAAISGNLTVVDEAYSESSWNSNLQVPTKNAIRDYFVANKSFYTSNGTLTGTRTIAMDGNQIIFSNDGGATNPEKIIYFNSGRIGVGGINPWSSSSQITNEPAYPLQTPGVATYGLTFKPNGTVQSDGISPVVFFASLVSGGASDGYVMTTKNFKDDVTVWNIESVGNSIYDDSGRQTESTVGLRNDFTGGEYRVFDLFNNDYGGVSSVAEAQGFVAIHGGGATPKKVGLWRYDGTTYSPMWVLDGSNVFTFSIGVNVPDEVYSGSWDGSTEVPTKNAIFDLIDNFSPSVDIADINATGTASASTYLRGDGVWATVTASAAWGAISGTLTDQTDLVAKFGEYLPLSGGTVTGNLFAPSFRVQGTGTGISNTGVLAVYESDGTTRQGYIGFGSGSSSDFIWYNDVGSNYLRLLDDGGVNGLAYNYSGGTGVVYHTGNSGGLVNTGSTSQTKTGGLAAQTLTTTNSGDGATLLTFNFERPWRFSQEGTGSGAVLGLQDLNGSKSFNILDPSGNRNHSFSSSGNYDLTGDIEMSKEKPILTLHSTKNGNWEVGETLSEIIFYGADGSSNGANTRGAIKLSSLDVFGIRFNMDFYTGNNNDPELGLRIGYDKNITAYGTISAEGSISSSGDMTCSSIYASGVNSYSVVRQYINTSSAAHQRMDAREEGSQARMHWYGITTSGSTGAALHSFFNGSSYNAFTAATSGMVFDKSVTAPNFILSSDIRLKKNIKTLTGDELNLNWVDFDWKDTGESQLGLIAQEVEKINPRFVNTNEKGFKSVKYIDVFVAKMAEKDRKDRDKDAKIKSLETRVSKLEKFLNLN